MAEDVAIHLLMVLLVTRHPPVLALVRPHIRLLDPRRSDPHTVDSLVARKLLDALGCWILQSTVLVHTLIRLKGAHLGVLVGRLLRDSLFNTNVIGNRLLELNILRIHRLLLTQIVSRPDLVDVTSRYFRAV